MGDLLKDHGTALYDAEVDRAIRKTPEGMAHWVGSGPDKKTCRECRFYTNEGRYTADGKNHGAGQLKPGRCLKYSSLMQGQRGKKFAYRVSACKHFDPHPQPPQAFVKPRWT